MMVLKIMKNLMPVVCMVTFIFCGTFVRASDTNPVNVDNEFAMADPDNDGEESIDEIYEVMQKVLPDIKREKVAAMVYHYGDDGVGQKEGEFWANIEFDFCRGAQTCNRFECNYIFDKYQEDNRLSVPNLSKALKRMGVNNVESELHTIVDLYDKSGDGATDIEEFCGMVQGFRELQ